MTLFDWLKYPIIRLVNKRGHTMIPQGIGIIQNWELDKNLEEPALFKCLTNATGDVNVVYWDGSTEIIDCQELDRLNMLIKQIKTTGTTITITDIRLEV